YAAGAMPEDERREYVHHLEEDKCAVCRQEVGELQSAVNSLAFSLPTVSPSASVKARLMAQANLAAAASDGFGMEPRRPRWFMWALQLSAPVALLLLLVVWRDNAQLRRLADSLNTRIVELESRIGQQKLMLATLTSSDVRVVNLAGQGETPRAGARIFW